LSGIFGLQYRDRDGRIVNPVDLERMSERLAHRGPDGTGIWCDGSIGLGHRALHTTPESILEEWPIVRASGDLVLVADARIDNRDELIAILDPPQRYTAITDGELILAAYQKWERACPEKLIGDFAFSIWDAKRGVLFCARDPMGVKPFYYYASDRVFVFASEIKALFCLPEVPRELDEVQLAYFLDWFRSERERTFYRNVRRLPAAHWLEVDANRLQTGLYWEADPEREIHFSTDDQYVEGFRELFLQAVGCRLRSAFPVGSALSGGLDSTSIVCAARRLLRKDEPLHTVSAAFPGLPEPFRNLNDESAYIDMIAQMDGIVSHRVRADELSVFNYLDRMFWHHDVPPFGFMYWMRWAVYEEAHAQGIRVFFSGDDGDSVVSYGYERFNDLARDGKWQTAIAELEALGRVTGSSPKFLSDVWLNPRLVALLRTRRWKRWREGSLEIARSFDRSSLQLMSRSLGDAFVPQRFVDLSRRLRGKKASTPLMRSDFARRIDLEERKRGIRSVHPDPLPTARESHAMVLPSPMLQHIMEVTDSMAGAFSIETRCPFLDRRLIEYSLAIPTDQKLAGGWTRLIQRKAMEGIVPPEIQWRVDKGDMGYNFVLSLQGKDRDTLVGSLFDEPEVLADYVDMDELRAMQQSFDSNGFKGARNSSGRLYIAAVLARWLRGVGITSPSESRELPA
jgi:asparagine synthase (glutamine-hydrolysing)